MDIRPFTLRDAIRGINCRRILALVIFASIFGSICIATLVATKKYESQANLFVRLGRENIGLDPVTTLGDSSIVTTPMSREAEINSVVHMIRSRNLFQEVVDEIGAEHILAGYLPGNGDGDSTVGFSLIGKVAKVLTDIGILNNVSDYERAVIQLTKKVSVKTLERSNVIMIRYEAKSPKMAQAVVSTLVDKYLEYHVKLHRTIGSQEFMKRQESELALALQQKEHELESFKTETGLISADLQKQELISRIGVLENQLLDASVLSTSLEAEVAELRDKLGSLSRTQVVSETIGTGNAGVDGMRQELYRQELQLEALLGQRTEQHPDVVALKEAIANAKKILATDEAQRTESVVGANPVFDSLQVKLLTKLPELQAAKAKTKALTDKLDKLLATLGDFSKQERKFVELTRETEIQDESYRRYMRSVAQAEVDASLEENKLSNISIAQPASLSEKPVRPNKLINLILAMALGTFGAIGTPVFLEYMSESAHTDDEQVESGRDQPELTTFSGFSSHQHEA